MTAAAPPLLSLALAAGSGLAPQAAPQGTPPALREVAFEQKLAQQVPLDIALRDEAGRAVRLGDYFGKRPVVLTLVYYECPMLCTLTLNGLTSALSVLSFDVGREFDVVTVSFEPKETSELAAAKKAAYLKRYKRPGAEAGWHFLVGDKPEVDRLTEAVGFRYAWDERTKQWAHPSGVVTLTPQGRISHYLFGIEYAPKDLRLSLVEAASGNIGTAVDQVLLYCYQYDAATGRYGAAIMRLVRALSVLTVIALGGFILMMLKRDRLPRQATASAVGAPAGRRAE